MELTTPRRCARAPCPVLPTQQADIARQPPVACARSQPCCAGVLHARLSCIEAVQEGEHLWLYYLQCFIQCGVAVLQLQAAQMAYTAVQMMPGLQRLQSRQCLHSSWQFLAPEAELLHGCIVP